MNKNPSVLKDMDPTSFSHITLVIASLKMNWSGFLRIEIKEPKSMNITKWNKHE